MSESIQNKINKEYSDFLNNLEASNMPQVVKEKQKEISKKTFITYEYQYESGAYLKWKDILHLIENKNLEIEDNVLVTTDPEVFLEFLNKKTKLKPNPVNFNVYGVFNIKNAQLIDTGKLVFLN